MLLKLVEMKQIEVTKAIPFDMMNPINPYASYDVEYSYKPDHTIYINVDEISSIEDGCKNDRTGCYITMKNNQTIFVGKSPDEIFELIKNYLDGFGPLVYGKFGCIEIKWSYWDGYYKWSEKKEKEEQELKKKEAEEAF